MFLGLVQVFGNIRGISGEVDILETIQSSLLLSSGIYNILSRSRVAYGRLLSTEDGKRSTVQHNIVHRHFTLVEHSCSSQFQPRVSYV